VPTQRFKKILFQFIKNPVFEYLIMLIILGNIITLSAE